MDSTYSVAESKQLQLVHNGLVTADRFINKNYLINLYENEILSLNEVQKSSVAIRLFKIEKLVYDKEENINDKLISVYSSLLNIESSAWH